MIFQHIDKYHEISFVSKCGRVIMAQGTEVLDELKNTQHQ